MSGDCVQRTHFNLFLMLCKKFGDLGGSIGLPGELHVA